jgi:hypothetical protein
VNEEERPAKGSFMASVEIDVIRALLSSMIDPFTGLLDEFQHGKRDRRPYAQSNRSELRRNSISCVFLMTMLSVCGTAESDGPWPVPLRGEAANKRVPYRKTASAVTARSVAGQ